MWFPVQREKIICEIGSKDRRSEKRVNFVWTCDQNICKWRWWLEKVYLLLKILFLTPSQQDLMAHVRFPLFSVIVNYWLLSQNLHQIQHIFFVFLFWIKKGYQQEKILNEDENLPHLKISCKVWFHLKNIFELRALSTFLLEFRHSFSLLIRLWLNGRTRSKHPFYSTFKI